ncbi:MAG: hypothetical protein NVS3B3_21620 [Aquirhabdus sp.]
MNKTVKKTTLNNETVRLLGNSPAAKAFGDFLVSVSTMHNEFARNPHEAMPDTQRYQKLIKLSKLAKALVAELELLSFEIGEDISIRNPDHGTAIEIRAALHTLEFQEIMNKLPTGDERRDQVLRIDAPLNYPTPVMHEIKKMVACIDCAARTIKAKRGNSERRNREKILQNTLAKNFVFTYRSCFGRFVPLSKDNAEHQLFILFLDSANLSGVFNGNGRSESEDGNFSLLRKHVNNDVLLFKDSSKDAKQLKGDRPTKYKKR